MGSTQTHIGGQQCSSAQHAVLLHQVLFHVRKGAPKPHQLKTTRKAAAILYMAGSFWLVHICYSPSMLQDRCATHACRRHAKTLCTETPESDHRIFRELREPTNVMA